MLGSGPSQRQNISPPAFGTYIQGTHPISAPHFGHTPTIPPSQSEFELDFLALLVSANTAFEAGDNRCWMHFFGKYLPQYKMPGSKSLRTTLLDRAYNGVIERWKVDLKGKYASGQTDGLKIRNKRAVVASLANVGSKVCPGSVWYITYISHAM
jgi:hypothetical protein